MYESRGSSIFVLLWLFFFVALFFFFFQGSVIGQGNLNKASFVSRRLIKLITIFGSLGGLVYVLHEQELLYRKVMEQCLTYKGHDPEEKSKDF